MPIYLIDKVKQKNSGTFKLLDASDINWDVTVPQEQIPGYISKSQVEALIKDNISKIDKIQKTVLGPGATLPDIGEQNMIYMKPELDGKGQNVYTEWMWINNKWEEIGASKVDLTNYATKTDVSSAISASEQKTTEAINTAKTGAIQEANSYTTSQVSKYLPLVGNATLTGQVSMSVEPTLDNHLATKKYVDAKTAGVKPSEMLTISDFSTGTTPGTFKVKTQEVKIAGLGSMAFEDKSKYLTTDDKLSWTPIQ